MSELQRQLKRLPSVDRLLTDPLFEPMISRYGREMTLEATRAVLEETRTALLSGQDALVSQASAEQDLDKGLCGRVAAWLSERLEPTLQAVINASGVVLHTNMGRAPLSQEVLDAMRAAGEGYTNLEFDLEEGRRGSRYVHAEALLSRLTGAEAAVLVNNNAGAVLLVLSALARDRSVIVSRGQLVEIGGGFRIPDVMRQSGAGLIEVGTTNRTYVADYLEAAREDTIGFLRVHASNFRQSGFVQQPSLHELVGAAHDRGLLLFEDLGSGTLLDTAPYGLEHEPTVQESVAAGVDVITFSGDKLLGGPQAGVIVGRKELIAAIRRHPLIRALRVDKTTIAGVQANLLHYVRGEGAERIPIWQMIAMPAGDILARSKRLLANLAELGEVTHLIEGRSMVGGGSLPEQSLPTWLVSIETERAEQLSALLRRQKTAVVTRIQNECLVLDLRTVLPRQDAMLARQLVATWREISSVSH